MGLHANLGNTVTSRSGLVWRCRRVAACQLYSRASSACSRTPPASVPSSPPTASRYELQEKVSILCNGLNSCLTPNSSKLDLLIRVRYHNPLPAPPCPPKLLDIPTDPKRYARPEFLDDIAAGTPLPMVVDGELGMPLDLSRWDCLWDESGDDLGTCVHLWVPVRALTCRASVLRT